MRTINTRLDRLEAERLKALRLRMVGLRSEVERVYSVGLLETLLDEVKAVMAELPLTARKIAYSKLEVLNSNANV